MTAAPAALGPLLVAATTQKGFNPSILIFVIIGAAFYFLIYRPQQRKQKAAREVGNSYDVGDEVVTAGGIVGRVLDITDDRVTLETSVGASFVVLKPYVLRKLEPFLPPTDVVDSTDHDHDDHEDHDHEDHDHEGPVPPPLPPEVDATEAHDRSQPTEPPPADDPDGTEGSGADGPPII
jgi:preprotein translocase subunit YajC